MATLTGSSIASTYEQLIKLDTETLGDDHSAKWLETGKAENLPIAVSTNRVGIGTASPNYNLEVKGDDLPTISLVYDQSDTDVDNDETLGRILFHGLDGDATQKVGASIVAQADGNWTAHDNNAPTRLEFYTQDGSDSTTLGSPRMTIEDGGKVGIGTAAPDIDFVVSSASEVGAGLYSLDHLQSTLNFKSIASGVTYTSAIQQNGNDMRIMNTTDDNGYHTFYTKTSTSNTERVRITNAGKVGIGTTSPTANLHILSADTSSGADALNEVDNESEFRIQYLTGTESSMYFGGLGSDRGYIQGTNNVGDAAYDISLNPYGGNIGIGTTSPATQLEIGHATTPTFSLHREDAVVVTDESLGEIRFTAADPSGTNTGCQIQAFAADGWSSSDYPSYLQFFTAPSGGTTTPRMTIDKDGNVGIGIAAPTEPLHVVGGTAGNYVARFDNASGDSTAHGIIIMAGDTAHADSDTHYIQFQESSGGVVGELDSDSGNLGLTDASDVRLKKNIVDTVTKGLEIVNGARMVDFEWKRNDLPIKCGIIAQELQKIFPRAVKEGEDEDKTLRIRKTDFIYVLVKAVQELSAKVTALESA